MKTFKYFLLSITLTFYPAASYGNTQITVLDCSQKDQLLKKEKLKKKLSDMELDATEKDISYLSNEPLKQAIHNARVRTGIAAGGLSAAIFAALPAAGIGSIVGVALGNGGATTALAALASTPALSKVASVGYVVGATGAAAVVGGVTKLSDVDVSKIETLSPEDQNELNRVLRAIALDYVTYEIDKTNSKILRNSNDRWTWGWDERADIKKVIRNLAIKRELLKIRIGLISETITKIETTCGKASEDSTSILLPKSEFNEDSETH